MNKRSFNSGLSVRVVLCCRNYESIGLVMFKLFHYPSLYTVAVHVCQVLELKLDNARHIYTVTVIDEYSLELYKLLATAKASSRQND